MSVYRAWKRLPDYLNDSRASTWLVLGMILGTAIALFYFAWLQSSHMGADVNGLAYRLHPPTDCG
jgi:hypothetical protein